MYRDVNGGGVTGTSFASIPYDDTLQGNVSETRLTAQPSRIYDSRGRGLQPRRGPARPQAGRLFRDGFQRQRVGHRRRHEHVVRLPASARVRRSAIRIRVDVAAGSRPVLHADDSGERSTEFLAVGCRDVAGGGHELSQRHDLGPHSGRPRDLAAEQGVQLGVLGGEPGAGTRQEPGDVARMLRVRHRRAVQHRFRRTQGAEPHARFPHPRRVQRLRRAACGLRRGVSGVPAQARAVRQR